MLPGFPWAQLGIALALLLLVAALWWAARRQGVLAERVDAWIAAVGWEPLVNRQGTTWRKLDEATKAGVVDAASAKALMLSQASVIKRPVIERDGVVVSVGFDNKRLSELASRLSA